MGSARQCHSGADMRGNRITDAAYGHWMGGKSGARHCRHAACAGGI